MLAGNNSDICSEHVVIRMSAVCYKYENGTSDRIIGPQRDEPDSEKMQVFYQLMIILQSELQNRRPG